MFSLLIRLFLYHCNITRKAVRAVGDITEKPNSYVNKGTDPCGIAHNAIELLQTLVVDAVEDLKELPVIALGN